MNSTKAAARSGPPHLLQAGESPSDDRANTEAALAWLAKHYAMTDRFARILLGQAANQDGVTEVDVARRLLDDLAGRADPSTTRQRGRSLVA